MVQQERLIVLSCKIKIRSVTCSVLWLIHISGHNDFAFLLVFLCLLRVQYFVLGVRRKILRTNVFAARDRVVEISLAFFYIDTQPR